MRSAAVSPCPVMPAPSIRKCLPLVGDRQPLAALGPPALENDAAVLGRHANPEPVRLLAATLVGLECAFPLHALLPSSDCVRAKTCAAELSILVVALAECQRTKRAGMPSVLQSRVRNGPDGTSPEPPSVSPPRFPQLWKSLWKSRASPGGPSGDRRFQACFHVAKRSTWPFF